MRVLLFLLFMLLNFVVLSYADDNKLKFLKRTEVGLSSSFRNDNLDWNIAGDINGNNPNILSELKWDDLEIWQVGIEAKLEAASEKFYQVGTFLDFRLNFGEIVEGKNTDTDYLGDNRSNEFSKSRSNSDDGDVLDVSLAIGPNFFLNNPQFSIVPLIGYSYHEQNLSLTNAYIYLPPIGPYPGLNSSYDTEWEGPWLGVFFEYLVGEKFNFTSQIEYHWADYSAVANWNLRDDLQHPKSFEHQADGSGISLNLNLNYLVYENWQIGIHGTCQKWETDAGIVKIYRTDGAVLSTRLNEVNWESASVGLKVSYSF